MTANLPAAVFVLMCLSGCIESTSRSIEIRRACQRISNEGVRQSVDHFGYCFEIVGLEERSVLELARDRGTKAEIMKELLPALQSRRQFLAAHVLLSIVEYDGIQVLVPREGDTYNMVSMERIDSLTDAELLALYKRWAADIDYMAHSPDGDTRTRAHQPCFRTSLRPPSSESAAHRVRLIAEDRSDGTAQYHLEQVGPRIQRVDQVVRLQTVSSLPELAKAVMGIPPGTEVHTAFGYLGGSRTARALTREEANALIRLLPGPASRPSPAP